MVHGGCAGAHGDTDRDADRFQPVYAGCAEIDDGDHAANRPRRYPIGQFASKLGNQYTGHMKTTLDLPDDLVKEVKYRAVRDGKKLRETVAELLRSGLVAGPPPPKAARPSVGSDPNTGLPLIEGAPGAAISSMGTDEIYALIHATQEEEDLERFGLSLRR